MVGFFRFEAGRRGGSRIVAGYVARGDDRMPHEEAVRDLIRERSQIFDVADVTGRRGSRSTSQRRGSRRPGNAAAASAHCEGQQMNASTPQSASTQGPPRRPAGETAADAAERPARIPDGGAQRPVRAHRARGRTFKGIWASGLSISAQFGVRDNNEASWTQVVDMLEFMADASDLPILLDGDTGYGNFNNMRRLVRKLEQRGIAGVCIEDKQFPKTNSFLNGERQPLADIDEFAGKIAAGKDTQTTEFLHRRPGRGTDRRLGHGRGAAACRGLSARRRRRDTDPQQTVEAGRDPEFAREWAGRVPLVIVPTKYYSTPTDVFRQAGISMVIWANHSCAAAASAMQSVAKEIHDSETLVNVEDRIASVNEIFRLQDADEYSAAERQYLSRVRASRSAVVLAASRGRGLEAVTADRPKVMLPIAGKPLLRWLVDGFKKQNINDITVVGGYRADAIDTAGIKLVVNERYAETGELASLACAVETRSRTPSSLTATCCSAATCCAIWSRAKPIFPWWWIRRSGAGNRTVRDFAYCSRATIADLFGTQVLLQRVERGESRARLAPGAARSLDRPAESAPPRARRLQAVLERCARARISTRSICPRCSMR